MLRTLNISIALCLAFVITLASIGVGSARGQAPAAGKMVLCTNHGPALVYHDAEGNPTGAPLFCPDCVVSLLAAVEPTWPHMAIVVRPAIAIVGTDAPLSELSVLLERKARSPPCLS